MAGRLSRISAVGTTSSHRVHWDCDVVCGLSRGTLIYLVRVCPLRVGVRSTAEKIAEPIVPLSSVDPVVESPTFLVIPVEFLPYWLKDE